MEHDYWHRKWQDEKIGFHRSEFNPLLMQYFPRLALNKGDEVFVPLCGKSLDMLWLKRQGYEVIGIELSKLALDAFFYDNDIGYRELQSGEFSIYRAMGYTLYCGDFFQLNAAVLQDCKAVYDRAALIAFSDEMRKQYVEHLMVITPEQCPILLVTLEYPQAEMDGPPFSVSEEEVKVLFGDTHNIEQLHGQDALAENAHLQEKGISQLNEKVYLLNRN